MRSALRFPRWIGALARRLWPPRPSFERCLRHSIDAQERVTLRAVALERAHRAPVQDS